MPMIPQDMAKCRAKTKRDLREKERNKHRIQRDVAAGRRKAPTLTEEILAAWGLDKDK